MEKRTIIIFGIVAVVLTAGVILLVKQSKKNMKIQSYKDALDSGLISEVLNKVISREGQSKKYTDIIPLDGGTVGIAHFAVGGLAELYANMDTQKYFGKSKEEMIKNYSTLCRPSGRSGNDTGWGCYSQKWWRDGMTKFVNSSDSKKIQDYTWALKMKPVIEKAISKGWNTQRQIAIALGIANSMGSGGFSSLASNNGWDSEKTLKAYVGSNDHRKRREEAINQFFPKS